MRGCLALGERVCCRMIFENISVQCSRTLLCLDEFSHHGSGTGK